MSDAIHDVDERARAIERALEAMHPPIEVYDGILLLIAEFASAADEWLYFDTEHFKVDDQTITRISKYYGGLSAYGAETISHGQRLWCIRIEKWSLGMFIGVSRNSDHKDGFFYPDSGYAYAAVRN